MNEVAISNSQRVDTAQAAAFLGLRPATLTVWRCTGRYRLPFIRVGRKIYYRVSDLEAWLNSRTENFTSRPKSGAV